MPSITTLASLTQPNGGAFQNSSITEINAIASAQNTNNTNLNTAASAAAALSSGVVNIPGDLAIPPHTQQAYYLSKGSAAALTLAAPTATTDDGLTIIITSNTAFAHVLTATGLFQDGTTTTNVATWPAHPGASITLMAIQAKWNVISNNLVVMS